MIVSPKIREHLSLQAPVLDWQTDRHRQTLIFLHRFGAFLMDFYIVFTTAFYSSFTTNTDYAEGVYVFDKTSLPHHIMQVPVPSLILGLNWVNERSLVGAGKAKGAHVSSKPLSTFTTALALRTGEMLSANYSV